MKVWAIQDQHDPLIKFHLNPSNSFRHVTYGQTDGHTASMHIM